jgi:hypothetical protein
MVAHITHAPQHSLVCQDSVVGGEGPQIAGWYTDMCSLHLTWLERRCRASCKHFHCFRSPPLFANISFTPAVGMGRCCGVRVDNPPGVHTFLVDVLITSERHNGTGTRKLLSGEQSISAYIDQQCVVGSRCTHASRVHGILSCSWGTVPKKESIHEEHWTSNTAHGAYDRRPRHNNSPNTHRADASDNRAPVSHWNTAQSAAARTPVWEQARAHRSRYLRESPPRQTLVAKQGCLGIPTVPQAQVLILVALHLRNKGLFVLLPLEEISLCCAQ